MNFLPDSRKTIVALSLCLFYGLLPASSHAAKHAHKDRIAFIGFDDAGSQLGPMMQPILDAQTKFWPTGAKISFYSFHFGNAGTDSAALDALINQVENLVRTLKDQGYHEIVLPDRSTFLAPFILGTGGSLTQPINVRHSQVAFGTVCPGTTAVDQAPNVFRFCDTKVDSLSNLYSLVAPGGQILVLFQAGDTVSDSVRQTVQARAGQLGIAYSEQGLAFNGTNFSASDLSAAASQIASLPSGSVVVHVVDGAFTANYTSDALAQGQIFVSTVTHYAGNYFPSTALPVDLQLGVSAVSKPSLELEELGFPISEPAFSNDPRQRLFIEVFGWITNQGKFFGVDDHHLQFDQFGTRIAYEIEDQYVPANTLDIAETNLRQNPRWLAERFAWSWSSVFK
jgi:hypothetical protein